MTIHFIQKVLKSALADHLNKALTPEIIRDIITRVNRDIEWNKIMNKKSIEE
jgi:hypothetical protein